MFQRRMDGSVDFYREWVEYKNGFGNLTGEFWLGLEKVHRLTSATVNSELRVDIEEFGGKTAHATYVDFKVADENSDFEIDFGNYSGNLSRLSVKGTMKTRQTFCENKVDFL